MFDKIQLSVMVGVLFLGCKNIGSDDLASNDDDGRLSSPWAMVELYLDASNDAEDAGDVSLHLSPNLRHAKLKGVDLLFEANGSLNFTAPDANNVATLAQNDVLIRSVNIKLVNSDDESVCPNNPIVASTVERDDTNEGFSFIAMDLACSGNKLAGVHTLAESIAKLAGEAWADDHEVVLKKVDEFYQDEKKKGSQGALHKGANQDINAVIDDFLIRRKMLKGYTAMYSQLEDRPDLDLVEMRNKVKAGDSTKHVVIPTTLSSFLDVRVNNRVTPDDSMGEGGDIDLLLMKEAIGNAAAKFLQYDHLFQSNDDFASEETRAKFNELKGRLQSEVKEHVDAIETRFNEHKTDDGIYTDANAVFNPLDDRLTCMERILSAHKGNGKACEEILGDFYQGLTALSCRDKEVEDGDVFMLLTTREIMKVTNIYDPCDKYAINRDKFSKNSAELIRDSVADIKNTALKGMEDIIDSYPGQNFRTKVLQDYFYAAVPVVTEYPQQANELAAALAEAHEKVYAKRASDQLWQKIYAGVAKGAAIAGIASVAVWVLAPPAGVFFSGFTSLLAALAVGGGAFLAVGYGLEAGWHERSEQAALERAIYSGGHGDVAGLADSMKEFREARRDAIWEGVFTVVGVGGARQLIRNPRALRTAYARANLKNVSWKNWQETRKAAKATAKEAEPLVRGKLDVARTKLKEVKGDLRKAKKKLKQDPDNDTLITEVDDLETRKADWLILRSKYRDDLPKGIVKRAGIWIRDGFVTQWNKIRSTKNVGTGRTIENAEEVKGLFTRAKGFFADARKNIGDARKNVYALNGEAWKRSDRIKDMQKFAQEATEGGGKFYWRLNKDGDAVFTADGAVYKHLPLFGRKPEFATIVDDFKLGKDGYWIAVLSASRLDELFGNRGKRAIEGGLQQVSPL